ncbi:HAMP domain-containing histidine kinase [Shewanella mesophila]|nr:HAMP domain-containing histidine kinase [Shewanella mesophila]
MNSLFNRILLSASIAVFVLFMGLWQWFTTNHQYNQNQIQQSLHRELAVHMAHINPLLSQGVTSDAALKEAFHDFMLLGPSFEIYTLDRQGKLIAFDAPKSVIKRQQVAIAPLQQFIKGAKLPILGQDPRSNATDKIFSAAALIDSQGVNTGYLYVIIGGQDYDAWQAIVSQHQHINQWGVGLSVTILFALALFVVLLKYFTAPISQLAHDMNQLSSHNPTQGALLNARPQASKEILALTDKINQLLSQVHRQHLAIAKQQAERHDFMLHLSHDLKTPLTTLQGYIDTWLLLPPHERDASLIEVAARAGLQLQQLLNQILQLEALENGQVKATIQRIPLAPLLNELKQYFLPRAQTQAVQLAFDVDENLTIDSDPLLLFRVLSNLVDNAIRYTPQGGKISINLENSDGQTWLLVTDNGSGIHQHELLALQQHSQEHKPIDTCERLSQQLPQLGVGLSIVSQLLRLLNCDLQVKSTPGKGCEFKIELACA